jgi:hypothetical protein
MLSACSGARFALQSKNDSRKYALAVCQRLDRLVFYGLAASTTLTKMPAFGILLMPTLALELFAAVAFLIREPARATDRTGRARLSAYGDTLFLLMFLLVANAYYPYWVKPTEWAAGRMAGIILWMAGSAWAAYSVWYSRYAFSTSQRRAVS